MNFLNIQYPIIQAPMLGVTTPEMVAAVSNAGALGSLPVGALSPDDTRALIKKTKALTNKPFAVNLFAHQIPESIDWDEVKRMQDFLKKVCENNHLQADLSQTAFTHYSYRDQIAVLIEEQVPIVSFTFGILDDADIQKLKEHNTVLIGTATSTKEAVYLQAHGIDAVTAQGYEAGGHRGTFLYEDTIPSIGTMALVQNVTDAVTIPVIAAGGIMTSTSIKAALELGAQGVQLGSVFLRSTESKASASYKDAVRDSKDTDTVVTKSLTGRWARGIYNTLIASIENSHIAICPYPIQNSVTRSIRLEADKQNKKELGVLWAGQYASKAKAISSAEIVRELVQI